MQQKGQRQEKECIGKKAEPVMLGNPWSWRQNIQNATCKQDS